MYPAIVRPALALCLLMLLTSCVKLSRKQTQQREPCTPEARLYCEGVGLDALPDEIAADPAATLGKAALRALTACAIRHAALIECTEPEK